MEDVTNDSNNIIYQSNKGKKSKINKPSPHQDIQCKNVFKDQNTVRDSLTSIWAEVINTLENQGHIAHISNVQSHTHHNHGKDEVSGE